MPALTQDRDTKSRSGQNFIAPVAAGIIIHAGALVALDATGNATPGATSTTLKGAGRAMERVDNSSGVAGDESVTYEKGVYLFANSTAGDEIIRADIGNDCYIVDDQTVAKTDGTATRSVAGVIADIDAQGVWVRFS